MKDTYISSCLLYQCIYPFTGDNSLMCVPSENNKKMIHIGDFRALFYAMKARKDLKRGMFD